MSDDCQNDLATPLLASHLVAGVPRIGTTITMMHRQGSQAPPLQQRCGVLQDGPQRAAPRGFLARPGINAALASAIACMSHAGVKIDVRQEAW